MGFDPVSAICDTVGTIVNKIWPDKTEEEKGKLALAMQQMQGEFQVIIAQIQTNAAETASADKYTSRWRPTVGYICCVALAYNFLVHPLLTWAVAMWAKPGFVCPPMTPSDMLYGLLFGMLGIGGMRTYEKTQGVAK
jgi:hypothetical protein